MSELLFIDFSLKLEISKLVSSFDSNKFIRQKNIDLLFVTNQKTASLLLLKPKLISNFNNNNMLSVLTLTDGSLILVPYTIPTRILIKTPRSVFFEQFVSVKISRNDYLIFFNKQ